MLRALTIVALLLLATGLQARQTSDQTEAENPFRIDLGEETVLALKKNSQGLIWKFDSARTHEHDGVWVTYESRSTHSNNFVVNDRTTKNLFSLDINDEILAQLFDDPSGLQAMIDLADRNKLTGVILRYAPSPANAGSPDASVAPHSHDRVDSSGGGSFSASQSSAPNNSDTGFNASPGQSERQLFPAFANSERLAAFKEPQFLAGNQRAKVPQPQDLNVSRQSSLTVPEFAQKPAGVGSTLVHSQQYSWDSGAPNQNRLAAADQSGYGSNQTPVRRDSNFSPQVAMNEPSYPVSTVDPRANNSNISAALASLESDRNLAIKQRNEAIAERDSVRIQLNGIASDYTTAKSQQFVLWFLLLLAVGLCLYLALLARGFYYRYGELADELRETFTTTN
jgi:hypothetical protein